MFKRMSAVIATVLAVLMTVGIGSAIVGPGADDSLSTSSTTSSTFPAAISAETTMYQVGVAGTVTISSSGSTLAIVSVDPTAGWSEEIEVGSGGEVEADFRDGTRRIQFNAELEDGQIKVRVREGADDNGSGSTVTTVATDSPAPASSTLSAAIGAETTMYQVGVAGTVTISSSGSTLAIVSVDPAAGWSEEIEVGSGGEVEADFRDGNGRVQFNAELEDGQIEVRVRERADG